jgi:hypothetical protein
MADVWTWLVAHWQEILILCAIAGGLAKIYKAVISLNIKVDNLTHINEERAEDFTILFKGTWACLDGLCQQGANGPVTAARGELQNHLFKRTGQG